MVLLKSNKSNLNKKNRIFYFKKNHDLYQPYSPKMLMKISQPPPRKYLNPTRKKSQSQKIC